MESCSQKLLMLFFLTINFHGYVSGQTCYSCTQPDYQPSTGPAFCGYSMSSTTVASCSSGCVTQVSGPFNGSNVQVTRGCATTSTINGCSYDAATGGITCLTTCNTDNCNGAVAESPIACYICFSWETSNCLTVNSATEVDLCAWGSCMANTITSSSGAVIGASRLCGIYPTSGSQVLSYGSTGETLTLSQCTSNLCNSGGSSSGGSSTTTAPSGIQCYSCTGSSSSVDCGSSINTDVATTTCAYGCSTMATYSGSALTTITRGCALSSCTTSVCTSYSTTTYCTTTCTTSNCNNYISTSVPTITTCNKASLIGEHIISTMLGLLLLVVIVSLY